MNEYVTSVIKELVEYKLELIKRLTLDIERNKDWHINPRKLGYDFQEEVWYVDMAIDVLQYYQSKLVDRDKIQFTKYFAFDVWYGERLSFNIYLDDDETESKIYNNICDSHSMINEFVQNDKFIRLIDLICPVEGGWGFGKVRKSFEDSVRTLNALKVIDKYSSEKDYKDKAKRTKIALDYLFELSENKELMNDIENIVTMYLNTMFKWSEKNDD